MKRPYLLTLALLPGLLLTSCGNANYKKAYENIKKAKDTITTKIGSLASIPNVSKDYKFRIDENLYSNYTLTTTENVPGQDTETGENIETEKEVKRRVVLNQDRTIELRNGKVLTFDNVTQFSGEIFAYSKTKVTYTPAYVEEEDQPIKSEEIKDNYFYNLTIQKNSSDYLFILSVDTDNNYIKLYSKVAASALDAENVKTFESKHTTMTNNNLQLINIPEKEREGILPPDFDKDDLKKANDAQEPTANEDTSKPGEGDSTKPQDGDITVIKVKYSNRRSLRNVSTTVDENGTGKIKYDFNEAIYPIRPMDDETTEIHYDSSYKDGLVQKSNYKSRHLKTVNKEEKSDNSETLFEGKATYKVNETAIEIPDYSHHNEIVLEDSPFLFILAGIVSFVSII